jgi:raffinose/stachyose/melibiose transport system permease protein
MNLKSRKKFINALYYILLTVCALVVLYPLFLMLATSLKTNPEVMSNPMGWPSKLNFNGYKQVLSIGHFLNYYKNSIFVTAVSLFVILVVSIMAAYPLARFKFRFNKAFYVYFLFGIMLPIRLAVVDLFMVLNTLNLFDSLWGLILIYSAMGIPFSVFIITGFMQDLPKEIEEAARVDGCSDLRILVQIFLPLIRPAVATALIYNFIPIWNDFYFPLIFLRDEALKTVPLGTAIFFGQFQTNWPTAFAALNLAIIPPMLFYLLMSKQFIKGLTAGAVKG